MALKKMAQKWQLKIPLLLMCFFSRDAKAVIPQKLHQHFIDITLRVKEDRLFIIKNPTITQQIHSSNVPLSTWKKLFKNIKYIRRLKRAYFPWNKKTSQFFIPLRLMKNPDFLETLDFFPYLHHGKNLKKTNIFLLSKDQPDPYNKARYISSLKYLRLQEYTFFEESFYKTTLSDHTRALCRSPVKKINFCISWRKDPTHILKALAFLNKAASLKHPTLSLKYLHEFTDQPPITTETIREFNVHLLARKLEEFILRTGSGLEKSLKKDFGPKCALYHNFPQALLKALPNIKLKITHGELSDKKYVRNVNCSDLPTLAYLESLKMDLSSGTPNSSGSPNLKPGFFIF